jgi:putative membrane protein
MPSSQVRYTIPVRTPRNFGLKTGSKTLQAGADQSHSGATDLANVIDDALNKIPDTSPRQTAEAAEVLGSPVGISVDNLNPAGVYGRGFAPFFFPIAVWVVGVLAYLFIRPVNLRAFASRVSALTVAAAGWLPVAIITAVGGLVLFGVVEVGLGLKPDHPLWVAGLLVLAAGAFVAVDHFLRISFGVIGEAFSLVLLIVQLTACGGLYPVETTPAPFRAVHPVIPMTYLVDGLRVAISGGLSSNLLRDVLVLAGFLVAFLGATALLLRRQRVWTVGRLHPQIEVL